MHAKVVLDTAYGNAVEGLGPQVIETSQGTAGVLPCFYVPVICLALYLS